MTKCECIPTKSTKFVINMIYPLILWITFIKTVFGHGKLWEPPSRSTMWRRGFKTPENPNDNELNCGGFENQWIKYGGRCGVCGDPFEQYPRPNEAGGKYAIGIISRHYKVGQIIELAVDITANHVGYFEFRICPNNDFKTPVTQTCLDKYPVFIVGSKDGRYHVDGNKNGIVVFKGRLPEGLECSQCVLQWRYKTGNRWGCDKLNEECGKGIGPQEEFYGCSDVAIGSTAEGRQMTLQKPVQVAPRKLDSNFKLISNPIDLINLLESKTSTAPVFDKLTNVLWTLLQTIISTNKQSRVALVKWNPIAHDIVELGKTSDLTKFLSSSKSRKKVSSTSWPPSKPTIIEADLGEDEYGPMVLSEMVVDDEWRTPVIRKYKSSPNDIIPMESKCHATKEFRKVEGTNQWCSVNCNAGNCPPLMCTCDSQKTAKQIDATLIPKSFDFQRDRNIQLNNANSVRQTSEQISKHKLLRTLQNGKDNRPNLTKTSENKHYQRHIKKPSQNLQCKGAGEFASHPDMVVWCLENCSKGFCPKTICSCSMNV